MVEHQNFSANKHKVHKVDQRICRALPYAEKIIIRQTLLFLSYGRLLIAEKDDEDRLENGNIFPRRQRSVKNSVDDENILKMKEKK